MKPAALGRMLVMEVGRVTEAAAIACAKWNGRGDVKAADGAATDAMRSELSRINIRGKVVIGEGEMDEAPMLYIGEELGTGERPGGRYRGRSARRHDAVRQGDAECAGRAGDFGARRPAACA